jgi:hypothetical protein
VDHSKEAKPVQTDGDKAQQRESLPAKQMKKKSVDHRCEPLGIRVAAGFSWS